MKDFINTSPRCAVAAILEWTRSRGRFGRENAPGATERGSELKLREAASRYSSSKGEGEVHGKHALVPDERRSL
jgi:hypothetical protein